MNCIVLSIRLFSKDDEYDDLSSKTYRLVGTKYPHLREQNVIHTCLLPKTELVRQQTYFVFFSTARISLCFGSIVTQSQIISEEPAFMTVSSMIYSLIDLFFRYFLSLYF